MTISGVTEPRGVGPATERWVPQQHVLPHQGPASGVYPARSLIQHAHPPAQLVTITHPPPPTPNLSAGNELVCPAFRWVQM